MIPEKRKGRKGKGGRSSKGKKKMSKLRSRMNPGVKMGGCSVWAKRQKDNSHDYSHSILY
jgi:hypothetical protein